MKNFLIAVTLLILVSCEKKDYHSEAEEILKKWSYLTHLPGNFQRVEFETTKPPLVGNLYLKLYDQPARFEIIEKDSVLLINRLEFPQGTQMTNEGKATIDSLRSLDPLPTIDDKHFGYLLEDFSSGNE